MQSPEIEPSRGSNQKDGEPLPGYTFFGTVLEETKHVYGFSIANLLNAGALSRTQGEQLSRISHNLEDLHSMRHTTLKKIIQGILDGATEQVSSLHAFDNKNEEYFRGTLGSQLEKAIEKDRTSAMEKPMALKVAQKLKRLTGESYPRLLNGFENSETIDDVVDYLQSINIPREN